jgi:hypothetical protein
MLTPKPQRIVAYGKQPVKMQSTVQIVLAKGATELERTGANQLLQTLRQVGIAAAISPQLEADASSIVLATADELPKLPFDLPLAKLRTFFARRGDEAYSNFRASVQGCKSASVRP